MSTDLEVFKDQLATMLGLNSRKDDCVGCKTPNLNFTDALSKKEYTISRFCQTCQIKIFGTDNEDSL